MAKVRLTKQFHFEMAHALWNYDGNCKNLHGHSYKLFVTIIGEPESDKKNPKCGMVMDFGDLKRIVNSVVIDKLDHAVMIRKDTPHEKLKELTFFEKIELTDYQPTCENMVIEFAAGIKSRLPENIQLFSLKLYETANSYAEWYATDNP